MSQKEGSQFQEKKQILMETTVKLTGGHATGLETYISKIDSTKLSPLEAEVVGVFEQNITESKNADGTKEASFSVRTLFGAITLENPAIGTLDSVGGSEETPHNPHPSEEYQKFVTEVVSLMSQEVVNDLSVIQSPINGVDKFIGALGSEKHDVAMDSIKRKFTSADNSDLFNRAQALSGAGLILHLQLLSWYGSLPDYKKTVRFIQ